MPLGVRPPAGAGLPVELADQRLQKSIPYPFSMILTAEEQQ